MNILILADAEAAQLRAGQTVLVVEGDPIAIPPTLHGLAVKTGPHNVPLFVAPKRWVDLADGAIHELRAACPKYGVTHVGGSKGGTGRCEQTPPCDHGTVLVATGSIEVVPVWGGKGHPPSEVRRFIVVIAMQPMLVDRDSRLGEQVTPLDLAQTPIAGQSWGIIIDCVQVAS